MHQPSKFKVSCAVHLARSRPAPTISSLLNSCPGPAIPTGACANVALLTYSHRLQSGHLNIIDKYGVNWKMHNFFIYYADITQLYDHSRVNTIERSEAYLQDIVQWRLKLSKTELIWFWLDRGHSIEKIQQQPLIRLNSQELSSSSSARDLGVIIGSGLTLTSHDSILARTCSISCEEFDRQRKTWTKTLSKHQSAHLFSHVWTTATRYRPTCQKWRLHHLFVSSTPLHGLEKCDCLYGSLEKPSLDHDDLSNYRPISNLSFFLSCLSGLFHAQLLLCLNDKNCCLQFNPLIGSSFDQNCCSQGSNWQLYLHI